MGALNAVAIAAETPQPTPMLDSVPRAPREKRPKAEPSVAPRWTSGPYWPTEAPLPSDSSAAAALARPPRSGT